MGITTGIRRLLVRRGARTLVVAGLAALAWGGSPPVGGDDPWRETGETWVSPHRGLEHRFLRHEQTGEKVRDMLKSEVDRFFRPEFLNRVDDLIYFRPLNRDDLKHIVQIQLNDVLDRLAKKNIKLVLGDDAKEFLLEKGYSVEFGARPLRRAIERYVEDPLSEEILRGRVTEGMTVAVKVGNDVLVFEAQAPEPNTPPPAVTATTA